MKGWVYGYHEITNLQITMRSSKKNVGREVFV